MTDNTLTPFPSLASDISSDSPERSTFNRSQAYTGYTLPPELVQLAWAHILYAYTRHDRLCFETDEHPLVYSTTSDTFESATQCERRASTDITTGVSFEPVTDHTASSLWLHHCLEDGTGTLLSHGSFSNDYLNDLGHQLQSELHRVSRYRPNLPQLPPAAHERLSMVNPHPRLFRTPQYLHQLLDPHANSDRTAVQYLSSNGHIESVTYAALLSQARSLASRIQKLLRQSEPSDSPIIPILASQSPELYVGQLAISLAGAAFCPLALDAPQERLRFVCEDTKAPLVLTTLAQSTLLPLLDCPILRMDEDATVEVGAFEEATASRSSLSYVMYTSGSTGKPKGVELSHAAVLQALMAHEEHIPEYRKFLQFAAPTFDVSIFEIYFTFSRGATLVCCDRTRLLDSLPQIINELQIDAAELTPTVAGTLLQSRDNCPNLHLLLTIGEMLTRPVVNEFGRKSARSGMLYAMYGPTEAAVHCTLVPDMQSTSIRGNIGRPLDSISAFVVDPDSPSIQILPIGQIGELALGGHQLANGYLNRKDQTEAAFVACKDHGILYRTGDKARLLSDGNLECLGRIHDGQVKLRGQRMELGEVEQVAMLHGGAQLAIASVIDDRLVLFVHDPTHASTRQHMFQQCRSWLPGFMIPNEVVFVDSVPRLPSGKVDKEQLFGHLTHQRSMKSGTDDGAATDLELELQKILQESLGRHLTSNDLLSENGLDSLRAIRFSSELAEKGYFLSMSDVLQNDSIRAIATAIEASSTFANEHDASEEAFKELQRSLAREIQLAGLAEEFDPDIEQVVPCSPIQLAMLTETSLNGAAYCNSIELFIHASASVVRSMIFILAHYNSILRSGFVGSKLSDHPFARIVRKELPSSQVQQVQDFDLTFSMQHESDFLNPFRVQIQTSGGQCSVLFHIHHALYDGWSWDLLVPDMLAILSDQAVPQRPDYTGYITSIHHYLSTKEAERSAVFWRTHLENLSVEQIPALTSHRPSGRHSVQQLSQTLSVDPKQLATFTQKHQVHAQTVLLTALASIMSSYTSKDDFTIGTVTAGRTRPVAGIEHIVGPCIHTLPLRFKINQALTTHELVQDTQRQMRDLLRHGELPLSKIKAAGGVSPGAPLFDILTVWQEGLVNPSERSDLVRTVRLQDYVEQSLLLEFQPQSHNASTIVTATYNTARIDETHMETILSQIDALVSSLVCDEAPTSCHDLALRVRKPDMSVAITEASNVELCTLHRPVEKLAERDPQRPALEYVSQDSSGQVQTSTLSFKQLNDCADRLAAHLCHHGIDAGEVICILMDKSPELYITELAIAKAGAAFLPISPETPQDRVRAVFKVSQARLCLVHAGTEAVIPPATSPTILNIDDLGQPDAVGSRQSASLDRAQVAYVIFTSGTTGTPKGVAITQGNIATNLAALTKVYPEPKPGSRFLQSCSQAFDVSVFDIFYTWYRGMCLVSARKALMYRDLEHFINDHRITHLSMTPTVIAMLDPAKVPTVENIYSAGEPMTEAILRKWGGSRLFNGYGPSETTNICSTEPTTTDHLAAFVGRPLHGTSAFVLDTAPGFRILPKGALGELSFGGDQVFNGYLNQSELSSERIIHHAEYGRIYRSGDLGRMLKDGSLICVGRLDNQVKIRGQRIELDEVDSAIASHTSVDRAITLVQSKHDSEQLVSFWTLNRDPDTGGTCVLAPSRSMRDATTMIYEHILAQLPEYMCPHMVIPLTKIPQTQNNKIDRKGLLDIATSLDSEASAAYTRASQDPGDEVDTQLSEEIPIRQILADLLGKSVNDVSSNASFYSYGVDSVSGIAFASRLRDHFNDVNIDVGTVLRNPSIRRLARHLSQSSDNDAVIPERQTADSMLTPSIKSDVERVYDNVEDILPCTPLQEAMLSASKTKGEAAYVNKTVFRVNDDYDAILEAWRQVMNRQAILRTRFMTTASKDFPYVQIVLREAALPRREAQRLSALESSLSPTGDGRDSPWTLTTDRSAQLLTLSMHHALYDGIAMQNLLHEVQALCRAQELPASVSFKSFLDIQANTDQSAADNYWKEHLHGFEPSSFPNLTGKSPAYRRSLEGYGTSAGCFTLPLSNVTARCQDLSLSLLSVCQSAWGKLLSAYLGCTDLCFGNVMSGRSLPVEGLERLVAPCFNTLPVRITTNTLATNSQLAGRLMEINAEHLEYQLTSLRRIQSKVGIEGQNLFDTLFILQQPSEDLDGSIWTIEEEHGDMEFPLAIEIVPNASRDTLDICLHYKRSVLLDQDTHLVISSFNNSLRSCLDTPQSSTTSIRRPSPSPPLETEQNEAAASAEQSALLFTAFNDRAMRQPNAPALEFLHSEGERETYTYSQLKAKAEDVANAIRSLGIGPEDAVVIHIAKSPQFYISVLGALMAGAAFTPFDVDTPEDRKVFMERELEAKVILVTPETPAPWSHCTCLDVQQPFAEARSLLPSQTTPSNLAYRLYTSGSTGRPKAVSVEHRSAVQTITESQAVLPWASSSRLLQYASTTFDMCYYDCFLALSSGLCLCAAPQATMFNDLAGTINRLGATMLDLTPSVASLLNAGSVEAVQSLYCIGEAMPQQLVTQWSGRCINSYGPTEAAMCVTACHMDADMASSVIGKPFASTTFRIIGPDDSNQPIFGVGELCIGGPQIAREYHANPDMTQRHFVVLEGQRFYKTGDRVRKLADDLYEFIGRTDDQVKIRGLRVELDEINSVVKGSNNAISGVTTQVLSASTASKPQLATFIAAASIIPPEDVRQACRTKLPAYMIPTVIIPVEQVPLSAAGKVNKRQLQNIFNNYVTSGDAPMQTRAVMSEAELTVANVLSELSGVALDSLSSETTLFQIGLDSISAVQVSGQLSRLGLAIEPTLLLQHPTVAGIAELSRASAGTAHCSEQTPLFDFRSFEKDHLPQIAERLGVKQSSISRLRPCTPFQNGSVAQFLHSKGQAYFNYMTLRFDTDKKLDDLRDALDVLCERHEMLRTGFVHLERADRPFIMVTYRSRVSIMPVTVGSEHDVVQWRHQVTATCHQYLHNPAWAALLQAEDDCVAMHLAIHHALYDAASLRMILEDLDAAVLGRVLSLNHQSVETAISRILDDERKEQKAKEFWQSHEGRVLINRIPDLTPLRTAGCEQLVVEHPSEHSLPKLKHSCQTAGVSLPIACQAAWARLLSHYRGEPMVTFGNVVSGRTDTSVIEVPFPCITTVPIIADCSKDDDQLLRSLTDFNATVYEYQFLPLNKVQRWLGLGEDAPFDSLFAFQTAHGQHSHLCFNVQDQKATVEYPLSIEIDHADNDGLSYRLTFLSDRIPRDQAMMILKQLDILLGEVLGLANNDAHDASMWSVQVPKEHHIPCEIALLHEFVERSARSTPNKIALEFVDAVSDTSIDKRAWTYHQLDLEGNRIAHRIIETSVQQRSLVAVCFDKCPEASFAMLGILKAGCGFVAIDHEAPEARKSFIVQDSCAAAIITMSDLIVGFGGDIRVPIVSLDTDDLSSTSTEQVTLPERIRSDDTSYCLYTSGTTGVPKGCNLSHDNAVQAMLSFQRLFRWKEDDRWLQFAGYHFDVSVLEQYWTWSVGLCMVGVPREILFEDLGRMIGRLGITHIDLTPALAQTVDPADVPLLCTDHSVFITGGEALRDDIIAKWGHFETIYNGYGPTEATIGCTMFPRVPHNGKTANIGPQFGNVGTLVVRPGTQTPVLRGAPGELCVFGPLVAKGYLNRAEKTAESFQEVTIAGRTERMYRTGDLVRLLHDGTFAFAGRADDQVKLRGQRIETREINTVIQESSSEFEIDAMTLKVKHPKQQKEQLVSFYCPKRGGTKGLQCKVTSDSCGESIRQTRGACQRHLPRFAVPTHIIPLNTFPLTANNKVDVKQLKALFESMSIEDLQSLGASGDTANGPLTGTERKVAEIICRYANTEETDVQKSTSVFELGLDSVTIIGLAGALRQAGFEKAQPQLIMAQGNIDRLSAALTDGASPALDAGVQAAKQSLVAYAHRFRSVAATILGVKRQMIESIAPCTPLQQGMISRAMESDEPVYFVDFRLPLKKTTDLDKLRRAWTTVVNMSQILRTRFVEVEEGHAQVVLKESSIVWGECETNSDEQEERLEHAYNQWWRMNRADVRSPLEVLITRTAESTTLVLHIFHALYDGNSLQLILDAILKAYNDQAIEPGPPYHDVLPYGPLRQTDGVTEFWQSRLHGLSHCRPIAARHASSTDSDTSLFETIAIPPELDECRRRLNVTHQAIIQACWLVTLADSLGPVATGVVVSGRQMAFDNVEKTIGPLFNTIPFCPALSSSMTWEALVRACHEFNVSALPYQHTPLRDIIKMASKDRSSQNKRLFDNLLVFQRSNGSDSDLEELWKSIDSGTSPADYPLALEVEQTSEELLTLNIKAQAGFADQDKLADLLHTFRDALRFMIDESDAHISRHYHLPEMASVSNKGNGHMNGQSKVQHGNGHTAPQDFTWTAEAIKLRKAIVSLAGLSEDDVRPDSSILELGLDSVDAIKLSSMLKKTAALKLSQKQIMRSLTVSGMSELAAAQDNTQEATTKSLHHLEQRSEALKSFLRRQNASLDGIDKVMPATPLQEAMVAEMQASDYETYFNHDVLELKPDVDLKKLKSALNAVVERNGILRTSFMEIEDPTSPSHYAQLIHEPTDVHFRHKTYDAANPDFSLIQKQVRGEVLANPSKPSLRLTLVERSKDAVTTHLLLSLPHALYDGWSIGLLHSDIQSAYHATPPHRPAPDAIFAEIIAASEDKGASEYWHEALDGLTPTLLDLNDVNEPIIYRHERVSAVDVPALNTFCKSHNASTSALAQTAFALTLAFLTTQTDVAFGVVLSGRDSEESQAVIFPTMNTVVMRSVLHGTAADMVKYTQETLDETRQHERYPLRQALAAVQREKGVARLFDALFLFQRRAEDEQTQEHADLYSSISSTSETGYPLAVEAEVIGDRLVWRSACSNSAFTSETARDLLHTIDKVLKTIIAQPDEQCLHFDAQSVSICGLPSVQQSSTPDNANSSRDTSGDTSTTAPDQQLLMSIRAVLAEVAQINEDEVSEDANIFSLGLDSILAMRVQSLLRKRNIRLVVKNILKAATPRRMATLAHLLDDTSKQGEASALSLDSATNAIDNTLRGINTESILTTFDLRQDEVESIMPATAGQVYMLAMHARDGIFQPDFEYQINMPDDFPADPLDRLTQAWNKLVASTPILRTLFVWSNKPAAKYLQVTATANGIALYSANHPETGLKEVDGFMPIGTRPPFARLLASQQESIRRVKLKLHIHHALYDGVSLLLLMQRLEQLIRNPSSSFTQSATDQLNTMKLLAAAPLVQSIRSEQQRFWSQYLPGVEANELPSSSNFSERSRDGKRVEIFNPALLSSDLTERLLEHAKSAEVTLQSLFLAAYARAYSGLISATQSQDIVIGVYLANRSLPLGDLDLSEQPIPTLNVVPLRVRSASNKDTGLTQVAKQIQEDIQAINSDIGRATASLQDIHEMTQGNVTVDTFVNFLALPSGPKEGNATDEEMGLRIEEVDTGRTTSSYARIVDAPKPPAAGHATAVGDAENAMEAYKPALDIEAAVTSKGGLAMGLFCDEALLDLEGAKKVMEHVRGMLVGL